MSKIFITGSSDGLGLAAAQQLIEQGHQVVLHARNAARAEDAHKAAPSALAIVTGDLSSIAQTRSVADQVNALGAFDAVIHNAGIGYREERRISTEDGLPHVFAVNTMAPYVLTALIERPQRLVYMSSGLHKQAAGTLRDLLWQERPWQPLLAYSETKFHDVLLALAVARRWPEVYCNALEPGWVQTKMGGPEATGDLDAAHRTQTWLATSDSPEASTTGGYFYHQHRMETHPAAHDDALQDELIETCARLSGVHLPE